MSSNTSRKRHSKSQLPREVDEQAELAKWLDGTGVLWTATANGAHLGGNRFAAWAKLRKTGVKKGVPDVLIFDTAFVGSKLIPGVAIELKRAHKSSSCVSDEQEQWLADLTARGWVCSVCYGAREAIEWLKYLGLRSESDGAEDAKSSTSTNTEETTRDCA